MVQLEDVYPGDVLLVGVGLDCLQHGARVVVKFDDYYGWLYVDCAKGKHFLGEHLMTYFGLYTFTKIAPELEQKLEAYERSQLSCAETKELLQELEDLDLLELLPNWYSREEDLYNSCGCGIKKSSSSKD